MNQIRVLVSGGIRQQFFVTALLYGNGFFVNALWQIARRLVSFHPIDDPRAHEQTAENAT